jgi:hypothetical protein
MVSAVYVPTDALPSEVPPDSPRREWPSMEAWLADPQHYWYPEPEAA